jgi:hypothetical protein
VNDPEAPALDPARLFGSLMGHEVRFVVVGGLAGQARGAERHTTDVDICPEWTAENLERLASALKDLGARLKIGEGSIDKRRGLERSSLGRPTRLRVDRFAAVSRATSMSAITSSAMRCRL